jgi:hypothetical protein
MALGCFDPGFLSTSGGFGIPQRLFNWAPEILRMLLESGAKGGHAAALIGRGEVVGAGEESGRRALHREFELGQGSDQFALGAFGHACSSS